MSKGWREMEREGHFIHFSECIHLSLSFQFLSVSLSGILHSFLSPASLITACHFLSFLQLSSTSQNILKKASYNSFDFWYFLYNSLIHSHQLSLLSLLCNKSLSLSLSLSLSQSNEGFLSYLSILLECKVADREKEGDSIYLWWNQNFLKMCDKLLSIPF